MLMESFSTNGATVLTIAILWCVVTWVGTYMYLKTKHSQEICRLEYTIEFLDEYIMVTEENIHRRGDVWTDYTLTEKGQWIVSGE
jgi:hypothetical protein